MKYCEKLHRFFTVKQVAEKLGVSTKTVRRRIASGDLAAVGIAERSIRISESALQRTLTPYHPAYAENFDAGAVLA